MGRLVQDEGIGQLAATRRYGRADLLRCVYIDLCHSTQMPLNVDAITAISRTVALEHGRAVEILGVTATDGGTDRAELLINITGCHQDSCRLLLNISRTEGAEFEVELRAKLIEALRTHDAG